MACDFEQYGRARACVCNAILACMCTPSLHASPVLMDQRGSARAEGAALMGQRASACADGVTLKGLR
eukprot:364515-Chlamydomonas_euryale.AAC.4